MRKVFSLLFILSIMLFTTNATLACEKCHPKTKAKIECKCKEHNCECRCLKGEKCTCNCCKKKLFKKGCNCSK